MLGITYISRRKCSTHIVAKTSEPVGYVNATDHDRGLEVIANECPVWEGAQLAADITLVPPSLPPASHENAPANTRKVMKCTYITKTFRCAAGANSWFSPSEQEAAGARKQPPFSDTFLPHLGLSSSFMLATAFILARLQ